MKKNKFPKKNGSKQFSSLFAISPDAILFFDLFCIVRLLFFLPLYLSYCSIHKRFKQKKNEKKRNETSDLPHLQRYLRVMKSRHTANGYLDTNADCFVVYPIQYTRDFIETDI